MSSRTAGTRSIDGLISYLFAEHASSPTAIEVQGWLASLPRFRAFAEKHRDKIRKKLRAARDEETRLDVRAELRAARLLLVDRGVELGFESYGSQRGGPDFTVTYRGARQLNLEVTRVRRAADVAGTAASLLAKLRQLPPSVSNAVLLSVGDIAAADVDTRAAAKLLRARADAKDEGFFAARGIGGTRAFYERFLRLGGVYVVTEADPERRATLWTNPSARIPIPRDVAQAVLRALRDG